MPATLEAPHAPSVAGGRYTAIQAADGTWTIKDVPVYPEHVYPAVYDAQSKRVLPPHVIDRAWLQTALLRARFRMRMDAYAAPAHKYHHPHVSGTPGPTPTPMGRFVANAVKDILFEGRSTAVLHGDFERVPNDIYEEIRAGNLPCVSAELLDTSDTEVSSVAFLPTEVPYFRMPLVTIGEEIRADGTRRFYAAASASAHHPEASVFVTPLHPSSPVVASSRAGAAASVLCRFTGAAPMPFPEKKPDEKSGDEKPEGTPPTPPASSPAAAATPPAAPAATPPAAPAATAATPPAEVMPTWAQKLTDLLVMLCEKAGIAPPDQRPNVPADAGKPGEPAPGARLMAQPPAAPPPPPPSPAQAPVPVAHAAPDATALALATEKGKNARLVADRDLAAQVDGELERLRVRGYRLPKTARDELIAAGRSLGEAGIAAYSQGVEGSASTIPPSNLEDHGGAAAGGANAGDSEAVRAYHAKGPAALAVARALSASYKRQEKFLKGYGITEEQHIAAQFKAAEPADTSDDKE